MAAPWFSPASPMVLDLILASVCVEAVALLIYHRLTGGGVAPGPLLASLGAGASLILALRIAVSAGSSTSHWIAVCLLVSLLAHLSDLTQRWQDGNATRRRRTTG